MDRSGFSVVHCNRREIIHNNMCLVYILIRCVYLIINNIKEQNIISYLFSKKKYFYLILMFNIIILI